MRFLDAVADDRLTAAYRLLAATGMRRGEVLGLRWTDVDLAVGRLSINRSLTGWSSGDTGQTPHYDVVRAELAELVGRFVDTPHGIVRNEHYQSPDEGG